MRRIVLIRRGERRFRAYTYNSYKGTGYMGRRLDRIPVCILEDLVQCYIMSRAKLLSEDYEEHYQRWHLKASDVFAYLVEKRKTECKEAKRSLKEGEIEESEASSILGRRITYYAIEERDRLVRELSEYKYTKEDTPAEYEAEFRHIIKFGNKIDRVREVYRESKYVKRSQSHVYKSEYTDYGEKRQKGEYPVILGRQPNTWVK